MPGIEAGQGQHKAYVVRMDDADTSPLEPGKHYLGVDAASWYINKKSSWFADRMASGTLDIQIDSGAEHYQAALGTFELKGGSTVAPVFDRPVLPDRNYVGGPITLTATLTGLKKDTAIASLLRSAAAASLGVAAGMVETATAAGPARLLGAAGDELLKGVKQLLSDTSAKRESLLDFSGLQATFQPGSLLGPDNYLLFHRGTAFDEDRLTVRTSGALSLPYVDGVFLEDGAWLLIRLRRTSKYGGQRPWFAPARSFRAKVRALLQDARAGVLSREEALKQLQPTGSSDSTLFDQFGTLRTLISNDGVLTEDEATNHVTQLRAVLEAARQELSGNDAAEVLQLLRDTQMLSAAEGRFGELAIKLYREEAEAIAGFRRRAMLNGTQKTRLVVAEDSKDNRREVV